MLVQRGGPLAALTALAALAALETLATLATQTVLATLAGLQTALGQAEELVAERTVLLAPQRVVVHSLSCRLRLYRLTLLSRSLWLSCSTRLSRSPPLDSPPAEDAHAPGVGALGCQRCSRATQPRRLEEGKADLAQASRAAIVAGDRSRRDWHLCAPAATGHPHPR